MLNFHHFEHVSVLWIFQIFLDFIRVIYLKLLKSFEKLFVKFLRQGRHILIIHNFSWVKQNYDYLNKIIFTSDSMDKSINWDVVIPAKKGIGAVRYYFIVKGTIGMITFSHLKGNKKDVNAYMANPRTVLDCDIKITCL